MISRELAETIREEVILYLRYRMKTGACEECGQTAITGTELNTLLTELERHGIAAVKDDKKPAEPVKPSGPVAFPRKVEKTA